MARRRRTNPLALAILSVLQEQPRHPYDIAATLKARQKHESIRLNYGALYAVVDNLLADGFVTVVDTVRAGRRPERTVYGITDAGRSELDDWLSELVASPEKEYTRFEAALSLLPSLPPDEAVERLRERHRALEIDLAQCRANQAMTEELGLPRLFVLELDLAEAHLRAEQGYVAQLVAEIDDGTLDGLAMWRSWYEGDPTAAVTFPLPDASDEERPRR